ncbi:MAG: YesL family protein [Lachnospiraceae bacterium]|nr:YesL family protein [Lachnospiraceae bacterium]
MDRMGDLMILNVLLIFFSLPIFTIGASLTALYTMTFKLLDETEGNLFKNFVKAFKNNFKQATVIWLVALAAGLFLAYDASLSYVSTSIVAKILMGVVILVAIVYAMWFSWVFPVQAKFDNPVKVNMKNAALMMVIHMFPTTLLITVLNVVPLLLLWFQTSLFFWMLPFVVLLMFAFIAYNNSKQLKKAFADYIPEPEDPADERGSDL